MATKGTKVPALKNIPAKTDPELRATLNSMKEAQEVRLGRRGDPRDRAITLRELIDSGLAIELRNNPFDPNAGVGALDFIPNVPGGNLAVPPAPTGLEASGAFTEIIVSWNDAQYGNHAYTEVWRSRNDDIGGATLVTTTNSFIVTDPVGYNQEYYYWVRFVSTSNVSGPFNKTNGVKATTLEDIAAVMEQLSEELSNLPGYTALTTLITNADVAVAATAATVIRASSSPSTRPDGTALSGNDVWFDIDDGQVYTRNTANNAWVAGRDATLVSLFGSTSFTGSTLSGAMATAQGDIVTVTNAQSSTASSLTSLTSTVGTNTSAIATEATTRANADTALSTLITNLTSTVSGNTSAISTEATTRANADTALSTLITNLTSTVSGNTSAISTEATTRANADSANATSISNLSTTVGTTNSNVSTLQTSVSNLEGDADAMFVIQVATESNGSKSAAGMVIGSNASSGSGAQSYVQFQADKFAIWSGSSAVAPFIIDNGVVYIDTARIKDGAIQNAKIQDGTIENAKIKDATIETAKIKDAQITTAKIDNLAVDNAKVFGNLSAAKITADQLDSARINVDTLNVKHFDNVSTDIKSHTGAFVPLGVEANVQSWSGTYPGQTIVSQESSSVVNIGCSTANIRNNAKYRVVYSAVLGDVRNGTIQYSFNNSSWVSLSPKVNANAGTFRTYVFIWDGQITGMSSSQSTVYWRITWNVSGGQVNSTYQALYVTMDNTQ